MTFEKGVPVAVNGKKMKVSDIIRTLNVLGGKHGIGIIDIVENRVVGMKSRGVYETPGGTILYAAHEQLEELILDRETMRVKRKIGEELAQTIYEGKWFTPLTEALVAFIKSTQEYVTGEVRFRLYKGNIIKAGETSPYSLYSEEIASFTTGDLYDHKDASGFITLFGLSTWVRALKMQASRERLTVSRLRQPLRQRSAARRPQEEQRKPRRRLPQRQRPEQRRLLQRQRKQQRRRPERRRSRKEGNKDQGKEALQAEAAMQSKAKSTAKKTADKAKRAKKEKEVGQWL